MRQSDCKEMRDVRSSFRPRTLQSIAFATKCLVEPLRSFTVYRLARIGYALRDIFCNLACILARQATNESSKQVECQNAHHEHRSGTARNRVQVGHHTFAVDLPDVHR